MAFDHVSKMNKVIFGDCRDTMRDLEAHHNITPPESKG